MESTHHATTSVRHSADRLTICAVATPPGVGGIATIRVSGPDAIAVTQHLWKGKNLAEVAANSAIFGSIVIPDEGSILDQAVVTIFRAPHSFTGEDVVEISVHGSRYIQRRLVDLLCHNGARLAEPGEFTRRAFANGKIDLAQAEAVADIIAANSRAAHRLAAQQLKGTFSARLDSLRESLTELAALMELELDFSEEEVEFASRERLLDVALQIQTEISRLHKSFAAGNAIKNGIPVAIAGPTNAGKSSLLNLLLDEDRAIVSDIHGTTRDTIEETITLGDYTFRLIDTAGLRATDDPVESLGIDRSRAAIARAAIVIQVADITTLPTPDTLPPSTSPYHAPTILLLNKTDKLPITAPATTYDTPGYHTVIPFSTKTHQGLNALTDTLTTIAENLSGNATDDTIMVTNARHAQALEEALTTITATIDSLRTTLPTDLIAQDLRATIHHLSTITGAITTPSILSTIFSRFCIGK